MPMGFIDAPSRSLFAASAMHGRAEAFVRYRMILRSSPISKADIELFAQKIGEAVAQQVKAVDLMRTGEDFLADRLS